MSETLAANTLASRLQTAWAADHGTPDCRATSLTGSDSLAVLLENAFTRAERALAESPAGRALVNDYLESLLRQVCLSQLPEVEAAAGRPVTFLSVSLNLRDGFALCLFRLFPG